MRHGFEPVASCLSKKQFKISCELLLCSIEIKIPSSKDGIFVGVTRFELATTRPPDAYSKPG